MSSICSLVPPNLCHLPYGALLTPLSMHNDTRGVFTEVFRRSWEVLPEPVQWNIVQSHANVLRGIHVHHTHWDYLIIISGVALVYLNDMRTASPSYHCSCLVPLTGARLQALVIPPGVAHGFYFSTPATHLYSVSSYWDTADELGCRWDDPMLGIEWPTASPLISPRDTALGNYQELIAALSPHQEQLMQPPNRPASNG